MSLTQVKESDDIARDPRAGASVPSAPIIIGRESYREMLDGYNPGAYSIPRDFLRFGTTEMRIPLLEILHAEDQRAYLPAADGGDMDIATVRNG